MGLASTAVQPNPVPILEFVDALTGIPTQVGVPGQGSAPLSVLGFATAATPVDPAGIVDSSAAINAALLKSVALGVQLFFPPGTYNAPTAVLPPGARVTGSSKVAILNNPSLSAAIPGTYEAQTTIVGALSQVAGVTNLGGLFDIATTAPHGLAPNQQIVVVGIVGTGGMTAAINGTWIVSSTPDGTHLTLQGSAFVGAYTSGGTVQASSNVTVAIWSIQPSDAAKAPFACYLTDGLFTGQDDSQLFTGYNVAAILGAPFVGVAAEPAFVWGLEQNYEISPGINLIETYLQFSSIDRLTSARTFYAAMNRQTKATTTSLTMSNVGASFIDVEDTAGSQLIKFFPAAVAGAQGAMAIANGGRLWWLTSAGAGIASTIVDSTLGNFTRSGPTGVYTSGSYQSFTPSGVGPLRTYAPIGTGTAASQIRTYLDYEGVVTTTNSAAATTILTIPIATNAAGGFDVHVVGRCTARTAGPLVGDVFYDITQAVATNVAGTVTAFTTGTTPLDGVVNTPSMAACAVTYVVSGTNLLIKVTGIATATIDWSAYAFNPNC